MNMEIGTEATQFPENQYINRIFVAVLYDMYVAVKYCHNISLISVKQCFLQASEA
jgi:hypothetical protein